MPKNIRKELGEQLQSLILTRGYRTMEAFAHENGFDKSWLSKVLRGKIDPGFTKVVLIATALDASLDEVFPIKHQKSSQL